MLGFDVDWILIRKSDLSKSCDDSSEFWRVGDYEIHISDSLIQCEGQGREFRVDRVVALDLADWLG
jgi:hypothetical protein